MASSTALGRIRRASLRPWHACASARPAVAVQHHFSRMPTDGARSLHTQGSPQVQTLWQHAAPPAVVGRGRPAKSMHELHAPTPSRTRRCCTFPPPRQQLCIFTQQIGRTSASHTQGTFNSAPSLARYQPCDSTLQGFIEKLPAASVAASKPSRHLPQAHSAYASAEQHVPLQHRFAVSALLWRAACDHLWPQAPTIPVFPP